MLGAERLLRFFLEEPECSFDVFLRWYQDDRRPSSASSSLRRRSTGSAGSSRPPPPPPPPGLSPGLPPDDLAVFRPELGLALANFIRDQSAEILETSQQCYQSPAKAAKYDYQSPAKAVAKHSNTSSSRSSSSSSNQNSKKRVQLFKGALEEEKEGKDGGKVDGDDDFKAIQDDSASNKADRLEERFSAASAAVAAAATTTTSKELRMVTADRGGGERKNHGKNVSRGSLDSAAPNRQHPHSKRSSFPPPPTSSSPLSLGDFVVVTKKNSKKGKKNKKTRSLSPTAAQESRTTELLRPATVQEIEEKQHQEQHSTTKENSVCENSTSVHTDASGGGPRKIDKHDLWTSIARGFDSSSNSTEEAKSREEVAAAFLGTPAKSSEGAAAPCGHEASSFSNLVRSDPALVTRRDTLDRLAALYAHVLRRNLCPNPAAELYLLARLLTIRETEERQAERRRRRRAKEETKEGEESRLDLLDSVHNCVRFAACALSGARHLLRRLDAASLGILAQNCRLRRFLSSSPEGEGESLMEFLRRISEEEEEEGGAGGGSKRHHRRRLRPLALPSAEEFVRGASASSSLEATPMESVRFDPGRDCATNFPSERNFQDFKKQRDLLYSMLRKFEESRRSGEFANGGGGGGGIRGGGSGGGSSGPLTRRSGGGVRQSKFMETFGESVRTLVGMNCHPTNVCRLARLVRDQLLANCVSEALEGGHHGGDAGEDAGVGVAADDPLGLRMRVGDGKTQQQASSSGFPGTQGFFRELILGCNHFSFLVHLRLALAETIREEDGQKFGRRRRRRRRRRTKDEGAKDATEEEDDNWIFRLSSSVLRLRTAARFLGLIESMPFGGGGDGACAVVATAAGCEVPEELIALRERWPPVLDPSSALRRAGRRRRLVLTLPWVAEMLSRLDPSAHAHSAPVARALEVAAAAHKSVLREDSMEEEEKEDGASVAEPAKSVLGVVLGELFERPSVPRELFFNTPDPDASFRGIVNGDDDEDEDKGDNESDLDPLDDLEDSLHPDLVRSFCPRGSPFLKECKRLVLQFAMGKKPGPGAVAAADYFARRLTSNKEKSNKDRKKVSLMVETDEDARTRRKKLLLAADGDHDMDGGGGAGGCTGDREQALLERNFFHNQSSDVQRSVEFVADLIGNKLNSRVLSSSSSSEASATLAKVEEELAGFVQVAFVDPEADPEGARRAGEELARQAEELAVNNCRRLRRDAKAFVDAEAPARVWEALSMLLPDVGEGGGTEGGGVDPETRRLAALFATKGARRRCYMWIKRNINRQLLAKTFRALVDKHWQGRLDSLEAGQDQQQQAAAAAAPSAIAVAADGAKSLSSKMASPAEVMILIKGLTESLACQKSPPNQVTEERVLAIAEDLEDCLEARNVADATVKGMVRLSVDFAVTLVAMAPGAIAASAQDRLVGLWSGTRSSSKTAATTATTTATATATATAAACDALQLNVLSSQTLRQMSLSPRPRDSWSRLESLLRRLCSAGLITPLVLEGQCLALTRMEWNPSLLERLASCMKGVVDSWKRSSSAATLASREEEDFAELMDWLIWFWQSADDDAAAAFDADFPRLC